MSDDPKKKADTEGVGAVVTGVAREYRAEFRKIVWPSRLELFRNTVTVIAVSAIFGAYIALNDFAFGQLYSWFVRLVF